MSGSATSASAIGSRQRHDVARRLRQRGRRCRRVRSLMRLQAQAEQPLLQRHRRRRAPPSRRGGRCGRCPSPHAVAELAARRGNSARPAGSSRRVRLISLQALDQRADDRRRQPLGRLVDQQQPARLDDRARDRQHLLLPARERAGARQPELASAPGRSRRSSRAASSSSGAVARRQHQVFPHREVGEHRHASPARSRCRRARCRAWRSASMRSPPRRDRAGRGAPQAHDGAQRRGLAGAVAAEQHRGLALAAPRGRRPAGCGSGRYGCARRQSVEERRSCGASSAATPR